MKFKSTYNWIFLDWIMFSWLVHAAKTNYFWINKHPNNKKYFLFINSDKISKFGMFCSDITSGSRKALCKQQE